MNIYFKSLLLTSILGSSLSAELVKTYFKYGELKAETNYVDGTHTEIQVGTKHGMEKVYYEMGALAYKVDYKDNKREGILTWYGKDGVKLADMYYKDGKLQGQEKSYFSNGKVKHIVMFINDKKEGKQKEYFENGSLALEVTYKNNKKEGLQKEYTPEGKIYSEVNYKNNYKEGMQQWFDANGKVNRTVLYKMDRPINIMKKVQEKKVESPILNHSIDFSPQKPE
jgi:antitoxin component YwqK of YwqJK toxin-antitoxin module